MEWFYRVFNRFVKAPAWPPRSQYEHRIDLDGMVGNWVDEDENVQIATDCHWTKNKIFVTRSYSVSADGQVELSRMKFIGWNPARKQIRSWTFDSGAGFFKRGAEKWERIDR